MKLRLRPQTQEPQNLKAGDRIRHPLRGERKVKRLALPECHQH